MTQASVATLVQNAALLLALAVVFDLAADRLGGRIHRPGQVAIGLILGALGVAVMLTPLEFAPGIIFDTRSVMLAVTGLFFGFVPTVVAMGLTAAFRLSIGGEAAITGVAVIIASGSIGLTWRRLRGEGRDGFQMRELLLFGLVVHLVMLALMFTLSLGRALEVLTVIGLPVLLVYPVATMLLGTLIASRNQRQLVRASLHESEERLRLTLEAAELGLYDLDLRTGEATTNDRYATMLGYDPASFHETNAAWMERLHPDDREPVEGLFHDYVAGRTARYRVEFRQRTAAADWKWILSLGRIAEWDAAGAPVRMLGTHLDITARKAAEDVERAAAERTARLLEEEVRLRRTLLSVAEDQQATVATLRASEERYRSLVKHAPMAVFVNRDDRLILVNDACVRLFGASSAADLLGRSPLELFHPDDHTAITDRIRTMREQGTPVASREERILRVDGGVVPVEVAAAPFDDDGATSIHVALLDITARKHAETAIREINVELERRVAGRTVLLEQANKELETFSYSVSHDLRAPLRAITGFAEILGRRYREQLDAKGRHYIDNIIDGGQHMGVLIEELLEYSRLGRGQVRAEAVPLGPILERLAITFAERVAEGGGRLEIVHPLAVPCGDPLLFEQILVNLLDNALTYRRAGVTPLVAVTATDEGHRVMLSVADNGIGIPAPHREKIFEVFARLHRDDEYPGTGIGLATVRKAARLMGSEITVASDVGVGSTFSIALPPGIPTEGATP
jgi:PAS domain S-box-containing protein